MERTLVIIKPDSVRKNIIGKIIARFESANLRVVAIRRVSLTRGGAEGFYAVHRDKPFFGELTTFMSSGPCVPMVLEGEDAIRRVREIMGATNYKDAKEGTLRRDFASSITENVVHGSDAPDTACVEIGYFFSGVELI